MKYDITKPSSIRRPTATSASAADAATSPAWTAATRPSPSTRRPVSPVSSETSASAAHLCRLVCPTGAIGISKRVNKKGLLTTPPVPPEAVRNDS